MVGYKQSVATAGYIVKRYLIMCYITMYKHITQSYNCTPGKRTRIAHTPI